MKIGQKNNSLTLVKILEKRSKDNHTIGLFKCDCGNEKEIIISRVRNGYTKTCNSKKHYRERNKTHGKRYSTEYSIWITLKDRCLNKNNKNYLKYSKLGIDDDIKNNFMVFLKEVGKRPSKEHSIDRIDNTNGYFKGNIRWANRSEQQTNRSNSLIVHINDEIFASRVDAAKKFNVSETTIDRWCRGYVDKRIGEKFNKPKQNCYYELRYKK